MRRLFVGLAAGVVIAGCATSATPIPQPSPASPQPGSPTATATPTTPDPAPTQSPAATQPPRPSPIPAPSLPPEMLGLWAGTWTFNEVRAAVAFTIHRCAAPGTRFEDFGCGHVDWVEEYGTPGLYGCSQVLAYLGTEGDAVLFQERTTDNWAGNVCRECKVSLTPMADGTLDSREDCGPHGTLYRVGASPAPPG